MYGRTKAGEYLRVSFPKVDDAFQFCVAVAMKATEVTAKTFRSDVESTRQTWFEVETFQIKAFFRKKKHVPFLFITLLHVLYMYNLLIIMFIYLDLPKSAKWLLKGVNSPSLRV